jgi:hypothetical protein
VGWWRRKRDEENNNKEMEKIVISFACVQKLNQNFIYLDWTCLFIIFIFIFLSLTNYVIIYIILKLLIKLFMTSSVRPQSEH